MPNSTIKTLLNHRSIRKFSSIKIEDEIRKQLINCARAASSSNHLQCISIIRVTDPKLRAEIKQCCSDQVYVQTAPEFWVFCIDFHKHQQICAEAQLDYIEVLQIGAVDCGIMAQNVLAAAESLGLGGVFIGSLRNQMEKVGDLLQLPSHCVPMLGLCLGYPDQDPPLKPRFGTDLMFFENSYSPLNQQALADFDQEMENYYQNRSQIKLNWTQNMIKTLAKPVRPDILAYLNKQGFAKK